MTAAFDRPEEGDNDPSTAAGIHIAELLNGKLWTINSPQHVARLLIDQMAETVRLRIFVSLILGKLHPSVRESIESDYQKMIKGMADGSADSPSDSDG